MTEMPLTPEIVEPRGVSLRRSPLTPELTGRKDGSLRRGSSTTPESSGHEDGSGEKILPHYLRASTGSCHDFCKYGRHHAFSAKEKQSLRKGNKTRLSGGQPQIEILMPQTRKKKPAEKLVSSHERGTQSRDAPEIEKHEIEIVEQKPSPQQGNRTMLSGQARKMKPAVKSVSSHDPETQCSDSQEFEKQETEIVMQKPSSSDMKGNRTTSRGGQHQIVNAEESKKKKPAIKLASSHVPGTQHCDTPKSRKQETDVVKQKPLSPDRKELKTTPSKGQRQIKSLSPQARKKKSAIRLTSSHDRVAQSCESPEVEKRETKIVRRKVVSPVKKTINVAKSSFALKPKHLTERSPSSLSPKYQSGRRDTDVKTGKIIQKKHQVPQKPTLFSKPSVNRTARLISQKPKQEIKALKEEPELPNDEIVSEKTIYVIETKLEKKGVEDGSLPSLSSPSSSSSPSLPLDKEEYTESDSEYEETETDSASEETQFEKRGPRSAALVHPEENDPGHKLKFRRGKVVDLQSENTEPRRLRFRKGRLLGDNQIGREGRRKSFKKRDVGDGVKTGEAESGKVVLRHQDVNGKKDAQGLFNNVIEETASKLAETRLSKVKALVGAFETVISLQESSKASATTSM